MPRLFVPPADFPNITGADAHYVRNVLRLQAGDRLELLDGTGQVHEAEIVSLTKELVTVKIVRSSPSDREPAVKVTLAQALPKGQKMDFVVEKCVELGVNKIIPVVTERTIGKTAKTDRWRKLAKEAAEQSGRAIIPEVSEPTDFTSVLKLKERFGLALLPWELEKNISLRSALQTSKPTSIIVLIGPEGGFSRAEVEQARAAGWQTVTLGKRILRTETAGLAVLANIMYERE
ncbi:MAG: 16S rRNA (uracil(1498)-N(3))-methyltransferase [Candidatus Margulisiibacteriota bacterium]